MMMSHSLVTAVALVDIYMVGRLGGDAVAAVGYATQFFFMMQSALFAVGTACVALMARSIGAGEPSEARRALGASLILSVGTAAVTAGLLLAAPRALLELLNAESHVIDLTVPYLRLVIGSSVMLAISLVLESALRADRNTVMPMRIATIVAAAKIGLNALLIFGLLGAPRLGLIGAGVATVISQVLGLVLFTAAVLRSPVGSAVAIRFRDLRPSLGLLPDVARLAVPGVAERVILNLALLSYFAVLGSYGTSAIAAYTVGVRALSFSWIPGIAFQGALATLVGQALGAGRRDEARGIGSSGVVMALGVAVVLGAVVATARGPIAEAFAGGDPRIVAALGPFMLYLAVLQPLLQVHFALGGVHRGAGDTWTPLMAATVGNWLLRVPVAVFLARVMRVDLVWLWSPMVLDHAARAIWLWVSFKRGGWQDRLDAKRRGR